MTSISTSNVESVLSSMYDCREELVPCFIGAPGIGKTQGIKNFAESKGAKMVTFILSTALPSEVSGIRMPDTDTKALEVFDDARMASLEDGDILFFDEILEAPPALWSACLTLIQDRQLASGRKLPDVFIVAASNPVANAARIPASFRDRFQFINLEWDAISWWQYLVAHDLTEMQFNDDDIEQLVSLIKHSLNNPDHWGYNILSPRRVTKLMDWMKHAEDKNFVAEVITSMFNEPIATHVRRAAEFVDRKKEQEENTQIALGIAAEELKNILGDEIELDDADLDLAKLEEIINQLSDEKKEQVIEYLKTLKVLED